MRFLDSGESYSNSLAITFKTLFLYFPHLLNYSLTK